MDDGEPREEIARLEVRIDDLARTIERCRKIVLVAKIAMTVGGGLLLVLFLGVIRFNPALMIGAMTAAIGGVVVFGSNASTAKQAEAEMRATEARRAELIGRIELRVIAGSVE